MKFAVRPYVTTGVALAGANLIAVTPIAPPPDVYLTNQAVRLATAEDSIANVPVNLFNDFENIPYNLFERPYDVFPADYAPSALNGNADYFADPYNVPGFTPESTAPGAIGELTAALHYADNWYIASPTNLWGWDPGNPPEILAVANVLQPFPALSEVTGQQLNTFAEAELPMDANCPDLCSNPVGLITGSFQVPLQQLEGGYSVGTVPVVFNSLDPTATSFTPNVPGDAGLAPWSGETLTFDPNAPGTAFMNSLMADPANNPIMPAPSLATELTSLGALGQQVGESFNLLDPRIPASAILGELLGTNVASSASSALDPSTLMSAGLPDLSTLLGAGAATDLGTLLAADLAPNLTGMLAGLLDPLQFLPF